MKQIFVAGAYTETSTKDYSYILFMTSELKKKYPFYNVFNPDTVGAYKDKYIEETNETSENIIYKNMVKFDLDLISKSDIVIFDITNKSTGAGMEMVIAKQSGAKIYLVAQTGSSYSKMITGLFPETEVRFYSSKKELKKILSDI